MKIITHDNQKLKPEIMVVASWSLVASLFFISTMTTTGGAAINHLLYGFRKCCSTGERIISHAVFLPRRHFYNPHLPNSMCFNSLFQLTFHFDGLNQRRRSPTANTMKLCPTCSKPSSCDLLFVIRFICSCTTYPSLLCTVFLIEWPPCQR